MEQIQDCKIRDAVMIYATRVLKLNYNELAFIAKVLYAEAFLVALINIRAEMAREDINLFSLNILEGIERQPGEDQETLGDKLVGWVHDNLEEYRKPD